jgi:hypothetical protein
LLSQLLEQLVVVQLQLLLLLPRERGKLIEERCMTKWWLWLWLLLVLVLLVLVLVLLLLLAHLLLVLVLLLLLLQ